MTTRRRFLQQAGLSAGFLLLDSSLKQTAWAAPDVNADFLERARFLLQQAPLIDTHNDLPTVLIEQGADLTKFDLGKVQPKLCADVPRLRDGCVGAQYWSVYVPSGTQKTHTSLHEAAREFDVALRMIRSNPAFEQAHTADDIERIHRSRRIACLLGVEGGHMMEDSAAALRMFYELGARYMTLTHWDNINWADAATDRVEHNGLTEFGKRTVMEMNRLGMFVDISHVSANTMRDAISVSRAPVLFSHSCAFAVDPHPRNVPDDVLSELPANGGVVHVAFIRDFIAPGDSAWQQRRTAALRELHEQYISDKQIEQEIQEWDNANPYPAPQISDVADHIDHIRQVAGIDHIGIGADFYDSDPKSMVTGLADVTRYPYLFAELLRRRYTDEEVLKIAGRNHLRAMRQMERVAAELQKKEAPFMGEEGKVLN
ncbi:MAG TPA: dipeptidase [Candidatus Koribacter sp.]